MDICCNLARVLTSSPSFKGRGFQRRFIGSFRFRGFRTGRGGSVGGIVVVVVVDCSSLEIVDGQFVLFCCGWFGGLIVLKCRVGRQVAATGSIVVARGGSNKGIEEQEEEEVK